MGSEMCIRDRALDDDLIARHLSPGGSADLLSLALFLDAAAPETWL